MDGTSGQWCWDVAAGWRDRYRESASAPDTGCYSKQKPQYPTGVTMSKVRTRKQLNVLAEAPFALKPRKSIPHQFVLDAITEVSPWTRSMFGCVAVYVGEKIVLILRERPSSPADNGVWLATTQEHHASLRREFPNMRSIGVLGKDVTGWQVLSVDSPDFEEAAQHACELVVAGDPRIGKVPGERRGSKSAAKAKKSAKKRQ